MEKLFYDFDPDKLRESIKQFNVDIQMNTDKINEYPLYVRLLRNCLKQIPQHRLSAEQLIDLLNVRLKILYLKLYLKYEYLN